MATHIITDTSIPIIVSGDPQAATVQRISVLGVGFDCLNMSDTLGILEQFIQEKTPRHICLANAYTVALARQDSELRTLLSGADLVLADGMSIVWGSRWIRLNLPGRVAGPNLMSELCTLAEKKNYRVFLLGSSPDNLKKLENVLSLKWPNLVLAGSHSPSFADRLPSSETQSILQTIRTAQPDILFVSMSAPKQEKWIAENLKNLQTPVCIGVGAAFDFLSGRIPRAPQFFQTYGLEWLYRLWCEPRRLWKRYLLGNAIFLTYLFREYFRLKLRRVSFTPQ